MYEGYFNLTQRPFATTPRADHYFAAASIEAARATLGRCIEWAEGAGMVVGPSGTGKTLLCQVLAEQFRGAFQVALLAGGRLSSRRTLLQAILYALGRPYRGMDEGELLLVLTEHITTSEDCPQGILLLVDEAHTVPLRLLDETRMLADIARGDQPGVRLVLAGNRALEERLANPSWIRSANVWLRGVTWRHSTGRKPKTIFMPGSRRRADSRRRSFLRRPARVSTRPPTACRA